VDQHYLRCYFTPIDELLGSLSKVQTGPWESFWLIFYALFTYVQAGLARDAVCQHMCPYSRFQGVMFDDMTRSVSYDSARGEPRSARRSGIANSGDCVDCSLCIEVCPTGIDIRDGLQYQCINCGLCADACDDVMTKIGAPTGLIRFAAESELAGHALPSPLSAPAGRDVRAPACCSCLPSAARSSPNAVCCWSMCCGIVGVMMRETESGIENAYTLRLMNLAQTAQDFEISASGITGVRLVGESVFTVAAGGVSSVPVTLSVPEGASGSGMQKIFFDIRSQGNPETRRIEQSTFALP
jgi:polyferredoxin